MAAVASTGEEYWVMSTSASAGTSSNCRLAACIAARQRATRFKRVGLVGRQLGDQRRHPVGPRIGLVAGADGHRDHRPQRPVGQRVVAQQVGAQATGADRHDDVVDRAARGLLDRLMLDSELVRMAKRRCWVIALFHGVGGAGDVGRATRDWPDSGAASRFTALARLRRGGADAGQPGGVGDVADDAHLGTERPGRVAHHVVDGSAHQLDRSTGIGSGVHGVGTTVSSPSRASAR